MRDDSRSVPAVTQAPSRFYARRSRRHFPHDFSVPPGYACGSIFHREPAVNMLSVISEKRSIPWRRVFVIEQIAGGHRVRGLCPFSLDESAGFVVGHHVGEPHDRQPRCPSRLRRPPALCGAAVPVELDRIFPGPDRVRRGVRRRIDILFADHQDRSRAILRCSSRESVISASWSW